MLNGKRILAVIPARSGSKRLPNKNVLPFHGLPLVAHSILAAKKSEFIDAVVVSSDSNEILKICSDLGGGGHLRSKKLSSDITTSVEVAFNVLESYSNYDIIIWLQPTSPLRDNYEIDQSLNLFFDENVESVVSVSEVSHSPLWTNTLTSSGKLTNFFNANIANKRSQDLEIYYQINGAIYISYIDSLIRNNSFLTQDSLAFVMKKEKSVDIDTALDFKFAELLYEELNG